MRRLLLASALVLAWAAPAQAHVQVTPTEAAPGDPVLFELRVPGEREAHTTEVAVQIPKGVLPFSFEDQPGWKRSVEQADDGSIAVVRWRGRLASDGFVRFAFIATTPEQGGGLVWKAVQRYDDGEEAAWIGPPDAENPAPVTAVSAAAARQNAGGEGAEAEAAGAAPAPGRRGRRRRHARDRARRGGPPARGGGGRRRAAPAPPAGGGVMRRATALLAVVALLAPAPALAHEGNPNYLSEISGIAPATDGVTVEVLNRDDRLLLHNTSDQDVVILGYDDEPYARVLADGIVEVNTDSEAYYLNDDRFADVEVPAGVDGTGRPQWKEVGKTRRFEWHDHRAHWMGKGTPPQVEDPGVETKVFDWTVPIEVGARRGAIAGTLHWTPLPGGGPPLGAVFAGAGFLIACCIPVFVVRHRRRSSAPAEAW